MSLIRSCLLASCPLNSFGNPICSHDGAVLFRGDSARYTRPLCWFDEPFLWTMLAIAAHEQSVEAVRSESHLLRYVSNWGRPGDGGAIALVREGGPFLRPAGAAWFRRFPAQEPGYGFLSTEIPELSLAVVPEVRGRGLGTRLVLEALAAARREGFDIVSLNVRAENPARFLYERCGFAVVPGSEAVNRVGGVSFNMVWEA